MNRLWNCLVLSLCVLVTAPALAQVSASSSSKEHEWLKQFEGEWESEAASPAESGESSVKCKGIMVSRRLGDLWVINEMKGEVMGIPITSLQTIGYDVEKKKYIATWVDSLMNHLWKCEGAVDDAGKKLVIEATGPHMTTPGKSAKYRDTYEFASKDQIIMTSECQDEKGNWVAFMKGEMKRKKK